MTNKNNKLIIIITLIAAAFYLIAWGMSAFYKPTNLVKVASPTVIAPTVVTQDQSIIPTTTPPNANSSLSSEPTNTNTNSQTIFKNNRDNEIDD